jgi:hypothetical protein
MKKKDNEHFIYPGIIILIWFAFSWLPHLIKSPVPNGYPKEEVIYNDLNVAYVAAGALFTALAFCVTFITLRQQRKDILSKTTLDVFLNVLEKIKNDPTFIDSKRYISSNKFMSDLAILEAKTEDKKVEIEDLLQLPNIMGDNVSRSPYLYVRYFCDKMDYIGLILKQKYIDTTILDYFRETIIESHKILEPLLTVTRQRKDNTLFIHYTYLYNAALNREKDFISECNDMIRQFEIDNKKRDE